MFAADVAATSTVGAGLGVSEKGRHPPIANKTATARRIFFISPSFGLGLSDNLHELSHDITEHSLGECAYLSMDDLAIGNKQHGRNPLNDVLHHPIGVF